MIELLILLILLYVYFIANRYEGFTLLEDSYVRTNESALDSFYCNIYDDLYNTIELHTKEANTIIPYLKHDSDVLCLDCRSGHLVQLLSEITPIVGLDTYIECCKKKYPHLEFKTMSYDPYRFKHKTHIICPLWSIHTKLDIGHFLSICYNWLIHKGYLFISYMNPFDMTNVANHEPSFSFQYNYKFSLDVEHKAGYNIITENIYKKGKIKRKNIWNYQSIQLDNLIYETSLRGFKYVKEYHNGAFHMALFTKT
jgi:hypothetical protein